VLEEKVVKASPENVTPAITKYDGVDYVPANKYVLYGHHFASIAGAGPIVGPAIAMVYGWFLPLIWVLFGNIFIGAVHDYLSLMSSVRYGGISVMSVSENVMGRKARFIFLAYVYFALVLVIAAFESVAAKLLKAYPGAATLAIIFMPLALMFGIMVYRLGVNLTKATILMLILIALGFYYAYKIPLFIGGDAYHWWLVILATYAFIAASLPVWYLLQPRDYLNAYILWTFVFLAIFGSLLVADLKLTGPAYTSWSPVIASFYGPAPFWPAIPLIIACGSLSGFHSVVASGTSSKQLSNEMEGLLVGYGGMLTEGAVSSLAVILPVSLAWTAPELIQMGVFQHSILEVGKISRFTVGYGYMLGKAFSRLGVSFPDTFHVMEVFAAVSLVTFILTTLDTATRLARFAWQEFFDPLRESAPGVYRSIANRWVAGFLAVLFGTALAYPNVSIKGVPQAAYVVLWPAFAGTNQLLAALALLTVALWAYRVQKVRGALNWLIQVPAWFLWITVTVALGWWLVDVMPKLPHVQKWGAGSIVVISLILDFILIVLFVKGLWSRSEE
ncbi:MAG: carbon starvation protein A, partial [Desulfurococcales archaeon]|nr:carbon starvation protein A [Desulfurococcales archaeon]